ncbi:MAG TPA: hypothetical protein VN914_12815 [Polyangia bacterium]|nr:hypothetical protein [Polyangia bacterium]
MIAHWRARRRIDRHFRGRQDPAGEQAMRRHLGACASCSGYYDRLFVVAQIDPAAPRIEQRLAAGLGFAGAALPERSPWLLWGFLPSAAGLILLAWFNRGMALDAGFTARQAGSARAPALRGYRVSPRGAAPLGSQIAATDELAFAYENPGGYSHLLVVGVDAGGTLRWFHPDPDVSDAAVTISGGPGRRELPEAIRHPYQGGPLRILGLFAREPLMVSRVSGLIDRAGCQGLRNRLPGVACTELNVIVKRPGGP